MSLKGKGGNMMPECWHKCTNLINNQTGAVITSQHKAWNDTVRMAMWLDLSVKPILDRDKKMLLWFDNCGCHTTEAVAKPMAEMEGLAVARLPPNMTTGIFQVLDLACQWAPEGSHSKASC